MIAWVYVGSPADGKFKAVSKLGIKYEDILYVESQRGDPPGTIWLTLRTGQSHLAQAPHRTFLENWKANAPLLLAPLDPPEAQP